jgi:hypothetical protein
MMNQQYYCRPEERGSDHCDIIPRLVNHEVGCLVVEIETKFDGLGWDSESKRSTRPTQAIRSCLVLD